MQKKKSFFFSFPRRSKFGEARVLAKSKRRKRRATKSQEKCKRKAWFSLNVGVLNCWHARVNLATNGETTCSRPYERELSSACSFRYRSLAVSRLKNKSKKFNIYVKVRTETLICKLINCLISLSVTSRSWAPSVRSVAYFRSFLIHWQFCFLGFNLTLILISL